MVRLVRISGLVAFVASLALLAWWWMRLPLEGDGTGRWASVPVDSLLFALFAVHHSAMARPWAQRWLVAIVPHDLMRTVYVWTASLLLAVVCLAWQRVGGVAWHVSGTPAAMLRLLQIAGAVLLVTAVRRARVGELAGVVSACPHPVLQRGGPYGIVRHPIYLGWVLIFCVEPYMTTDRLLFAALSTAYLAAAVPFEEAGLLREFGAAYRDYRTVVRWRIVPFVY